MNAPEILQVTLLRHGESVGNAQDRFQGQADFPLNDLGRAQARALAARWRVAGVTFDACISSPLLRALETGQIICAALDIPLETAPGWMEVDNGVIAGLTREEGDRVAPRTGFVTPYTRLGLTGESRWQLFLRAGQNVQDLLDRRPARYLVVSHGGILNMVLYAMLGIAPHAEGQGPRFIFSNTAYARLAYEPGAHAWRFLELCQPAPVGGEGSQ